MTRPEAPNDVDYLARNGDAYEELVGALRALDARAGPELKLALAAQAAWFATVNHPGRFSDDRVENAVLAVGRELDRFARRYARGPRPRLPRRPGRRHVLHVATEVAGVGGHTRITFHWARLDRDSTHSLVLTRQAHDRVPEWLRDTIVASGGGMVVLPATAPALARARWLRELARDADVVLLNHFTEDVVPVAALATPDGPPVGLLNQSDHVFWVGNTVADAVVNLREIGRTLSRSRRGARRDELLPLPLEEPPTVGRAAARAALGLSDGRVVALSVGRGEKYRPSGVHNFFATGRAILADCPEAELHLVGLSPEQARGMHGADPGERFRCAGQIESPDAYRAAADVYLESFPFGSQTAMLEAGLAGLPVVPAFAPLSRLLVTQDEAYDGLVAAAATEGEYRARVAELLRSPGRRLELGRECARRVRGCHTGDNWLHRLHALYAALGGLGHRAEPLAPTPAAATPDDVGLSVFHADNYAGGRDPDARPKLRRAALEAAHAARTTGEHLGAWQLLRYARRHWGADVALARASRKLLPHWVLSNGLPRRRPGPPVVLSGG